MRISDWSSDVCSSDLLVRRGLVERIEGFELDLGRVALGAGEDRPLGVQREEDAGRLAPLQPGGADQQCRPPPLRVGEPFPENGRASSGERVCQYVYISVVAV